MADCLIRGRKLRPASRLFIRDVSCRVTEKIGRGFQIEFESEVADIIEKYGETPLPFYIKERLEDSERYQTIYSKEKGSIAAPTAGLHFTSQLFERLKKKGVDIAFITLHIGPSTFLPLNGVDANMQSYREHFSITEENASKILEAIESASHRNGGINPGHGWSDLFIKPGYKFNLPISGMITNFHLPSSSLLLLVCAMFGRDRVLDAYKEAVQHKYRFYSFGDAMFVLR